MGELLRLSEHYLSQQWLAQFRTPYDRGQGTQLLNQLKLVSSREFEAYIEESLIDLQKRLQETIAVYPVCPTIPDDIVGYDLFRGGVSKSDDVKKSREVGRRRKYGSEDRVGHFLNKLQKRFQRGSGSSCIECNPTLNQLDTQGIKHIVLVDDLCGSGKRITDYWKSSVPNRIKSLLSFKRCELWIVLYAITPKGKKSIKSSMPNFPLEDHLITALPEADLGQLLPTELSVFCSSYAKLIGVHSSGIGYRNSGGLVVFEHGCPNNLPEILWFNRCGWKGLFPNGSIPTDLRSYFEKDSMEREVEVLWQVNQPKLALSLLEAVDRTKPLTTEQRVILSLLGLRLRSVPECDLARRLLMTDAECKELLRKAVEMGLYDLVTSTVSPMGREVMSRFRAAFGQSQKENKVGKDPSEYYPQQCEGRFLRLGKTDRKNSRSVPME